MNARLAAIIVTFTCLLTIEGRAGAEEAPAAESGVDLYDRLSLLARSGGEGASTFRAVTEASRSVDWAGAAEVSFNGNVRQLDVTGGEGEQTVAFFLVREESGDVHVLAMPTDATDLDADADTPYAGLLDFVGTKTTIQGRVVLQVVDGREYSFLQLTTPPERLVMDRLFFVAIIFLLFLTMVGMGLTLTFGDFALVFRKPAGMIIGPICQFGLLPLLAMLIGRLAGYYETYPFIFLGLILVASSPGGVTSNLMTYLGKGDVALSVSLTAVCTVLALFFTPFLLTVFGGNIPDFQIPVGDVFKQMLVLVIVPLFVGMTIRWKAERFAKRSEKVFAGIGVFSLLFLIVVGILGNLDKFADTDRYGFKFYTIVFILTFAGMIVAGLIAKLVKVSNFQVRAISIECGLRNASLAMTIAILIQDRMGDFYSSMLFTSGIFGLWMYAAGALSIWLFPRWLPVSKEDLEELARLKAGGDAKPAKKPEEEPAEEPAEE